MFRSGLERTEHHGEERQDQEAREIVEQEEPVKPVYFLRGFPTFIYSTTYLR